MKNSYLTDREYKNYFFKLGGIRSKIAKDLLKFGLPPGIRILDILSGHSTFACEIAKVIKDGEIIAIGLESDVKSSQWYLDKHCKASGIIKYQKMDVTQMSFPEGYFDMVVNFIGLEDVNMTYGKAGVKKAIKEATRVLKKQGIIEIALNINGNEPDEILSEEISRDIGHNAFFYEEAFYMNELRNNHIEILSKKWYYTRQKLTLGQAKEELRFACEETPKIYKEFRVRCKSFEDVWNKFESRIAKHRMALYSDILVLIGKKMG